MRFSSWPYLTKISIGFVEWTTWLVRNHLATTKNDILNCRVPISNVNKIREYNRNACHTWYIWNVRSADTRLRLLREKKYFNCVWDMRHWMRSEANVQKMQTTLPNVMTGQFVHIFRPFALAMPTADVRNYVSLCMLQEKKNIQLQCHLNGRRPTSKANSKSSKWIAIEWIESAFKFDYRFDWQ